MFFAPMLVALVFPLQQQPPRDPMVSPGIVLDDATREAELTKRIAASPTGILPYRELAKLQEARGAFAEAEATLLKARERAPRNKGVAVSLAQFYSRRGDFDKAVEMLDVAEQLDTADPTGSQLVATYYWEKAYRDKSLLPADQMKYIMLGIAATDRSLALRPDYAEALTYKNILLRMRANLETDPVQKQQLIAEADALRARVIEVNKSRTAINGAGAGVMMGPPPPPPPPGAAPVSPSGMAPVRVGGNIKTPMKVRDVRPLYPLEAQSARISGVVIIEAMIDTDGHVYDAKILRSIPMLDQAALDAVRQWEFTPTLLEGVPVPVIMTVTVNFTLQ